MVEPQIRLGVSLEKWPLAKPLRFAFATLEVIDVVIAELTVGDMTGRGEGIGVFYVGDTPEKGAKDLERVAKALSEGAELQDAIKSLTSYAARNAIDCAIWDLKCKRSGKTIWELTGVDAQNIETFVTISLDEPSAMAKAAKACSSKYLKLKINEEEPVAQVAAVRNARPDAVLMADANQAFSFEQLLAVAPDLANLSLAVLEQPLQAGEDELLGQYDAPLLLCADESCFGIADLDQVQSRYGAVNIKLDKTGGLTEGLRLQAEAHKRGLITMVGCMAGTSLSMAPAFVIACNGASYVDLDGPVLLRKDREGGALYDGGLIRFPISYFWG